MTDNVYKPGTGDFSAVNGFGAEIVVVGSGAAGCALVPRLLEHDFRVLVLEAGGEAVDPDASEFLDVPKSASFGLSIQLGGSTNLWSGRTAPLENRDITAANGWPFERSSLDESYDQALALLRLSKVKDVEQVSAYSGKHQGWRDFVAAEDVKITRFQWSRPPFSGLAHFRNLAAKHPNLKVLLNSRVTRVLVDESDKSRVAGVEVAIGKTLETLFAPIVVLCAGGLETPRLLMNSHRRSGHSVFVNENIGRYFSTHPKANVGKIHLFQPVETSHPLFSDIKVGGNECRFGVGSPGDRLNHYVQFSGKFESIGLSMLRHAEIAAAQKNWELRGSHCCIRARWLQRCRKTWSIEQEGDGFDGSRFLRSSS